MSDETNPESPAAAEPNSQAGPTNGHLDTPAEAQPAQAPAGPAAAPDPGAAGEARTGDPIDALFDPSVQQQLLAAFGELMRRIRTAAGSYLPPPFSPAGLAQLLRANLERYAPGLNRTFFDRLRTTITEDVLNIETWKGVWFVINYSLEMQAGFLKRRLTGDYSQWYNVQPRPTEKLIAVPETYNLNDSWLMGISLRPDYNRARLQVEMQGLQVKYDKNQLFPQLQFIAGYGRSGVNQNGSF